MCCSVLRAPEETMTGRAAGSDQTSIMLGLQEQVSSPWPVLLASLPMLSTDVSQPLNTRQQRTDVFFWQPAQLLRTVSCVFSCTFECQDVCTPWSPRL